MDIKLGLDIADAANGIDKISSGIANTQKNLDKISKTITKLTSGTKSVKLNGNFTSVKSMLKKIDTETKKIAAQNIKLNVQLKSPGVKELKSQLDALKIPDIKIGVKLNATKKDLQNQLNRLLGTGLNINTGKAKSSLGNIDTDLKTLSKNLLLLNKTIETFASSGGFGNFIPNKVGTKAQQKQQYYNAYSENAQTRARNAQSRAEEVKIRKDLQDVTELQKAMYAARAQAELAGGRMGSSESFIENLALGLQRQTRQGGLLNEVITDTVKNKTFSKGFKEEALKTKAFAATGKSSINDLTQKEMASVTTEMTKSGAIANIGKVAGANAAGVGILITALEKLGKVTVALGKESIQAYEGVQKLQTQLGVVYGSQSEASTAFSGIEAYAKKSPFGVETMTSQAVLLKQSGVYSSELMEMLQRIGDISSGNNEKMKSISETYARVLASTTVTARDMRQLANAGVPVYREMADQLSARYGRSIGQNQVRSMLQSGKVKATDLTEVIKNLTNEGGTFYGATEVGAKTLAAKRQNLDDAKQMALAGIGRWLSEFGMSKGSGAQSSYYNRVIDTLDKLANNVETFTKDTNYRHQLDDTTTVYRTLEMYKNNIANAETEEDRKEFQSMYDEYFKAHSDYVEKMVEAGAYFYDPTKNYITKEQQDILETNRDNAKAKYDELARFGFGDTDEAQQYFADYENYKRQLKNSVVGTGSLALYNQAQFSTNLTANAESLDKIIQALEGSVGLRNTADTAWRAGTLGKAYEQRDTYIRNANLRNELDAVDAKFLRNGEYDFTGVGASVKELSHAFELLAEDSEKLDLTWAGLMPDGQTFTEESQETVRFASERMNDLITATRVSARDAGLSIDDFLGEDIVNQLNDFTFALEDLSVAIPEDVKVQDVQNLASIYETLIKSLSGTDTEAAKDTLDALQKVMTRSTLSSSGKEMLNRRKTASLWAQVLGSATGIDATRITLDGRGTAMNAYRDNLSQRQMFSDVAKALMNNGASFGEITSKLRRTGTGYDGTSLYDWRAGMSEIEQMAADKNVATQTALINAYQSQIDTLNNLEVAGLATADSWSELEYISQGLGSAFNVTAEQLADGTYRFTDETIRAVERMKSELSAKKFALDLQASFRKGIDEANKSATSYKYGTSLFKGVVPGASGLSVSTYESASPAIQAAIDGVREKDAHEIYEAIQEQNRAITLKGKDELQEFNNKAQAVYEMMGIESTGPFKVTTPVSYSFNQEQLAAENEKLQQAYAAIDRQASTLGISHYNPDNEKAKELEKEKEYLRQKYNMDFVETDEETGLFTKIHAVGERVEEGLGITEEQINNFIKNVDNMPMDKFIPGLIALNELVGGKFTDLIAELTKSLQEAEDARQENAAMKEAADARDFAARILGINAQNGVVPLNELTSTNAGYSWSNPFARERLSAYGLPENVNEGFAYRQLGDMYLKDGATDRNDINSYTENYQQLMAAYIKKRYASDIKNMASVTYMEPGKGMQYSFPELQELFNEDGSMKDVGENLPLFMKALGQTNEKTLFDFDLSSEGMFKFTAGAEVAQQKINGLKTTLAETFSTEMLNMYTSSLNKLGSSIYKITQGVMDQSEAWEDVARGIQSAAGEMLSSMGAAAAQAGLSLIAQGDKSKIALGIALIAAGGFGNLLGGYLSAAAEDADDNKDEQDYERLQKMRDSLADLLRQARDDAVYYETTLRGKKAIATNDALSSTQVHDMILTPQGNFSTDPDDYIIASKNPSALGGGANPNITVNVINTSGGQLSVESTTERKTNDGLELDVVVNGIVKQAMNDGEYDDVLQGVESRQKGYSTSS